MDSQKISSKIRQTSSLSSQEIEQIWTTYSIHHNVTYQEFLDRTVNQFEYIAIYQNSQNSVVGFTGIRVSEIELENGKHASLIYFGQTFIEQKYRGKHLLSFSVLQILLKRKLANPFKQSYMWFDAICYKPFMLASKYSGEFYPNMNMETPKHIKDLTDAIGYTHYPTQYNRERGTVVKSQNRIKDEALRIGQNDLRNKYIRFFAEKNPGHAKGDGLICIIPNKFSNYLVILFKVLSKVLSMNLQAQGKFRSRLAIRSRLANSI